MFAQILVAVDQSSRSQRLVEYLQRMLDAFKVLPELTLLQVAAPSRQTGTFDDSTLARDLSAIADNLDLLAMPLKAIAKVSTQITPGNPGKVICDVASEGYELVVMGSRGLSDMDSLLLGSVSSYVSQHAPCPVLIVREH